MSFRVGVRNKSSHHLFNCNKLPENQRSECSKVGFTIDGQEMPVLFLNRGQSYTFEINTPGHPFYFTTDPVGAKGPNDPLTLIPQDKVTDQGTLSVTIDDSFPHDFYYQCQNHPRMGGKVKISLTNIPSPTYYSPQTGVPIQTSEPKIRLNPGHPKNPGNPKGAPTKAKGKGRGRPRKPKPPKTPEEEARKQYLLQIAQLAESYGFVPIPVYGKMPRFQKWQNVQYDPNDPTKNLRRVEHLIDAGIANNISILAGKTSGVVVLDVDPGSLEWFRQLVDLNGGLPETFIVQTGSNGMHIYFQYEPRVVGLTNMNKIGGQDIDFRTDKGPVVFPGSISNETGQTYFVLAGYVNERPVIAQMPDWLLTWIQQNVKPKRGRRT